ncbi:hypothetical protein LCGC14_0695190 [marine sediment metagenome]|jgi:hypothetical protein|uniref:Uncharacterized protein n=1 Tax=marine sediment metagenome TaxID=412755 RepID=A0A0F9R4P0_9ZZZZ|nr:hypothetical protein [Methylophaga aminisulfidivorans]HEC60488.1 hypothetical protein [Methylophaga sp.]
MNTKIITFIMALSTAVFTLSAQAHDPKEHMKNAEKPDCTAMEKMDKSKMDMQDPITQAMMKQCMDTMDMDMDEKAEDENESQSHADESTEHTH